MSIVSSHQNKEGVHHIFKKWSTHVNCMDCRDATCEGKCFKIIKSQNLKLRRVR